MHITWHGNFTVKIQSGETTLVLDPYAPTTGLPPFRSKASLVALTNPSDAAMSHLAGVQGEPEVIDSPGEYALAGFTLHALGWRHEDGSERSVHRWKIENLILLHVGALSRELTDTELQELEKTVVDILFVPVGGGTALSTKQAVSLVMKVEPRIVIPINFQLKGLAEKLESVEQFAKEMGVNPKAREKKLLVKPKSVPQDEMTTVILMP